eukprot:TRINITY_DN7491_c0_g1_i1.p1 TRINITY_DN7491_c0_g1~~TRINITY_DN7491_c0_g1_i1.p1  ORF type:complete len:689 (+),score=115.28 TRINITY_DN7491_c0_g1_i1:1082-3148(+)
MSVLMLVFLSIVVSNAHSMLPFSDPLLTNQWHLHNITDEDTHSHINVIKVWEMGITGKGVVIAIIDDGIDLSHPDLEPNWLPGQANWNFYQRSSDIQPKDPKDWHGTACAGLAVAHSNNDICGVGVAPNANFTGIVMLQEDLTHTDATAAQALSHEYDINHIYSNSWGPEDDGRRLEGPGPLTIQAMMRAIEKGRSGLGSLYVWAAGNGKQYKDNCNYDGYANSRYVATFGAISKSGVATPYSEPCSSLIGVLPSGDGRHMMTTTDVTCSSPTSGSTYSTSGFATSSTTSSTTSNESPSSSTPVIPSELYGKCNVKFSGTSAAAPLAAGIAALILEANPNITWLDFQYILKLSATKNDPLNWSWFLNGVGTWVSHSYGFGLIDSYLAVKIALNWTKHIQEVSHTYIMEVNRNITEKNPFLSSSSFSTSYTSDPSYLDYSSSSGSSNIGPSNSNNNNNNEPTTTTPPTISNYLITMYRLRQKGFMMSNVFVNNSIVLHHVEIVVYIKHPIRGNLDIRLVSPSGTESILAEQHDDKGQDYHYWKFTTILIWGENSFGNWTLAIDDTSYQPDHFATLVSWSLTMYGISSISDYPWLEFLTEVYTNQNYPLPGGVYRPRYSSYTDTNGDQWKMILMIVTICGIFVLVVIIVLAKRCRKNPPVDMLNLTTSTTTTATTTDTDTDVELDDGEKN